MLHSAGDGCVIVQHRAVVGCFSVSLRIQVAYWRRIRWFSGFAIAPLFIFGLVTDMLVPTRQSRCWLTGRPVGRVFLANGFLSWPAGRLVGVYDLFVKNKGVCRHELDSLHSLGCRFIYLCLHGIISY